jgi:hypothetical protein
VRVPSPGILLGTPSTDQRLRRVRRGKSIILYTVIVIIVKMTITSLCNTHDENMKILLDRNLRTAYSPRPFIVLLPRPLLHE